MARAKFFLGTVCVAALSVSAQVDWQVGWPGCAKPTADDFTAEAIVTRGKDDAHSPIKIDFHVVEDAGAPNGYWTNFYFNELHGGKIKYYSEATNSVSTVGTVPDGKWGGKDKFSGLVLDPGFDKTNRWIYTHYSTAGKFRVARFTITETNTLDVSSMKVLLEVPKNDGQWHGECAIDFDAYGDLWIGYGDNGTHNKGNGNWGLPTNDMRGSIVRIHPEDDGTYTIPSVATGDPTGNMGEYWSKQFAEMGEAELAAQYKDHKKVLPEIYVKGIRQPYTLKVVHARNRWVAFGDVGPDFGKDTEEFNILQQPGFAGWPVWAGVESHKGISGSVNIEGITRLEGGASQGGASGLPPVIRSQYDMHQASGMSGPIYWYDGKLKSDRKFPAYYHGKWFIGDNDQAAWKGPPWVRVLTMNEDYTEVASAEDFFGFTKERIQEIYFGPDGALYIAYFYKPWHGNSADNEIWRFSYKGADEACLPTELVPPPGAMLPPAGVTTSIGSFGSSSTPGVHFTGLGEFQISNWKGEVRLFDVLGHEVPIRHTGGGVYQLQAKPTAGVYFLKAGADVLKVSNIRSK